MNWFNLEWGLLILFWGGLVGSFFHVKSVFQPHNNWLIPACYFMFSTPIVAIVNIHFGVVTLLAAVALEMQWSTTNIKD